MNTEGVQLIHAKCFVNRIHLVLHACVETFDVTFFCIYGVYEVYEVGSKQGHSDLRSVPVFSLTAVQLCIQYPDRERENARLTNSTGCCVPGHSGIPPTTDCRDTAGSAYPAQAWSVLATSFG